MCLDNPRRALVLALGRNDVFATGVTNWKALLIQLSGRGAINCLETKAILVYGMCFSVLGWCCA